jgi:hypothetical protein
MDKQNYNEISSQSFSQCGQELFDKGQTFAYIKFQKQKLNNQLACLLNDLYIVNAEIDELSSIINNLINKYNLNSQFSIFPSSYGITIFQIKKTINNLKKKLKNKENEKQILLLDIETTDMQIIDCNNKLKNTYKYC